MIIQEQQNQGWGDAIIDSLSQDLRQAFPDNKGFSRGNLYRMRIVHLSYKDESKFVAQLVRQIPWGHNIVIVEKVKDSQARIYYLRAAIENGWSRNVLVHQIETDAYSRHVLTKKTTNFTDALPIPLGDQANEMLKDPYIFDFIKLEDEAKEAEVERSLIIRLRDFLMELGKGFAFLGSQYRVEVGGEEFFIDLLFFHRGLRCLVALELKTGKFKPEYAGKMNFYLNALDDLVRMPAENPSIGIILCKSKNKAVAEYALRGVEKPIGVSEYQLTRKLPQDLQQQLPTVTELEEHLKLKISEHEQ